MRALSSSRPEPPEATRLHSAASPRSMPPMSSPDLPAVPEEVLEVCRRIAPSGGRAYLVGGSVRDALLGLPVRDWDLEVFGLEADVLEACLARHYRVLDVGKSYGVLKLEGLPIDVALPRRETKVARGHRGFHVDADPHLDLRIAAERRDLRINALYYSPLEEQIEDPLGGLEDLRARRLRHCSERFSEDPLRVLRVMQFAARFDQFHVDPETIELCASIDLDELPLERVAEEWRKLLLAGRAPSHGLRFLVQSRADRFFPEFARGWRENPDRRARAIDGFVEERVGEPDEDLAVGLAVLASGLRSDAVRSLLERVCPDKRVLQGSADLVAAQTKLEALSRSEVNDASVRLLSRAAPLAKVLSVARCLAEDEPHRDFLLDLSATAQRLQVLERPPAAWVQGRHLIELGTVPGAHFSEILEACYEAQLAGEVETPEAAQTLAAQLLKDHRRKP